ncbi:hypothetical protein CEXT_197021 [Caerostris extrusa]|uniref:Uncharacterized protein n=1 Tax=Caerostris extrusa TaxID=172846 RepID=A0AAV4S8V5_CAEEX|nr:hypothetical protein CEXT_197021 [Caerostris extrusa]
MPQMGVIYGLGLKPSSFYSAIHNSFRRNSTSANQRKVQNFAGNMVKSKLHSQDLRRQSSLRRQGPQEFLVLKVQPSFLLDLWKYEDTEIQLSPCDRRK